MTGEWLEWHEGYERDPTLVGRLRTVQDRIREALDRSPPGPIQIISVCAGDGRDLLGAMKDHPRAHDVHGRLVELTPELVVAGRERADREGARGVEFANGDASSTSAYAGAVPADIILVCGVFGNISDEDIRRTIDHLPELCAKEATVIWTRGLFEPDLTPSVRRWFGGAGFTELSFVVVPGATKSVGANRLAAPPRAFRPGVKLFTFLPKEERPSTRSASTKSGITGTAGS